MTISVAFVIEQRIQTLKLLVITYIFFYGWFIFLKSKHSVSTLLQTPVISLLPTAYFSKLLIHTKELVELQFFVSMTLSSCEVNA